VAAALQRLDDLKFMLGEPRRRSGRDSGQQPAEWSHTPRIGARHDWLPGIAAPAGVTGGGTL